jgi:hypothetical protein
MCDLEAWRVFLLFIYIYIFFLYLLFHRLDIALRVLKATLRYAELCALFYTESVYGFLHIKGHVRVEKDPYRVRDTLRSRFFLLRKFFCTFFPKSNSKIKVWGVALQSLYPISGDSVMRRSAKSPYNGEGLDIYC